MNEKEYSWNVTIESFRQKDDLLHGWGTLSGHLPAPETAWAEFDNGRKIPALFGKSTQDTASHCTHIDFVLYGTFGEASVLRDLSLVLQWEDGNHLRLPLPPPRPAPPSRGVARILALPWAHYFARGWRLIRQRQTGLLLRKFAGMAAALLSSGWPPEQLLKWAATAGRPLALVIDHDLGGGANQYRQNTLKQLSAQGYTVLLLSAHHGILSYQLTAVRSKRLRTAHIDDLDSLFGYLSAADIRQVIFNNILSFPSPLNFVDHLTHWIQQRKIEHFLFLVHDHYCICPVWLLLDHTGKYCDLPAPEVCSVCLSSNKAAFLELAALTNITAWREAWRSLLEHAHEIRCFSEATRRLVLRAHPQLAPEVISVVPHRIEQGLLRPVKLKDPGFPVIGIIGHLSYHKGGKLVQELAEYILRTQDRIQIVVIGTIDYRLPEQVTTITGPYQPNQLPDLVEEHGVNVGWFPSICPETFSYVAEEMMTMGLPVIAFDIGAPGERIARYAKGCVLPILPPVNLLPHLIHHYRTHVQSTGNA